jgi:hypothetical protein
VRKANDMASLENLYQSLCNQVCHQVFHKWQRLMILVCVGLMWFGVMVPEAIALVQIKLTDIDYHECPPELAKGAVTAGGTSLEANCFLVSGKAENPSSKTIYNADIFGRIFDANEDPIVQNRTRLGSIDEVPPGVSDFEMRISVPKNQPTPLQLKQFKAAGFTGNVRR